jgi:hypothetical protein
VPDAQALGALCNLAAALHAAEAALALIRGTPHRLLSFSKR